MADKKKHQRCYIYTRVSTQMQVEGYSLEAQRERLMREAKHRKMEVAHEFSDEGKSGKNTTGRPQFQEMMGRIEHGSPDGVSYVLVFKLSRFGRNTADVLNNLQIMEDCGVNLLSVDDGIDSAGAAGKLMIAVIAAVAEIERENIKAQTTAGRQQKAREGRWNSGEAPLGYRLMKDSSGRNSWLVIDEEEAQLIRLIFEKYAHTGMGYSGVAKWLNRNGYRREIHKNGKHEVFTDFFIKSVLDNPVYAGWITSGRFGREKIQGTRNEFRKVKYKQYDLYEGQHEAIISRELWQETQVKRETTAGKALDHFGPKNVHILSGIVKCPVCGSPMYGTINRKKKKDGSGYYSEIPYYICKNTRIATGKSCSYTHSVRQDTLDEQVIKSVQQAVNNMTIQKGLIKVLGSRDDLDELTRDLDRLKETRKKEAQKKSRLIGKIANLDADDDQYDTLYDDLQGVLRQYNRSISELDDQIEETSIRLHNAKAGEKTFEELLSMLRQSVTSIVDWSPEQKRTLMHNILESVEIYPKRQPDGFLVKNIRFKFPLSIDKIVDTDYNDDYDDNLEEDDPPSGGGPAPRPKGPTPDGTTLHYDDNDSTPNPSGLTGENVLNADDGAVSTLNPNTVPEEYVTRKVTPLRG